GRRRRGTAHRPAPGPAGPPGLAASAEENVYEGRDRGTGEVKWTAIDVCPDAQAGRGGHTAGQAMTASIVFFSALGWAGDLGAFFRACSSLVPSSWSCLRPRPARTLGN